MNFDITPFYEKKVTVLKKNFPIKIVESSIYVFIEDFYFYLDETTNEYIIYIKPKEKKNINSQYNLEFQNELINQMNHHLRNKENLEVKNMILSKILLTNKYESHNN